jgi:hemolysin activation/secretion protein
MTDRLPSQLARLAHPVVLFTAWVMALPAGAQQLPPSTDPGRLQERFGREPEPPRSIVLPEFGGGKEAVPDALKAIRVTISSVKLEGARAIPEEQLQARIRGYLGHEITGAEIFDMARVLTAAYRDAGYLLSYVLVPPQTLVDGKLMLRVIEGYVTAVRVEGDPSVTERLVRIGEKIQASRPLNVSDLERYLLIANDLPGVKIRSVFYPSHEQGAANLTLVATVESVQGFASLDTYGSKYLGTNQLTVSATVNQLPGAGSQIRFIGVGAGDSNLSYGQLSYSQAIGPEGLKIGASISDAVTRPGNILSAFDIRGHASAASLSLSYPLLRSRNSSLTGRAVFDQRHVTTDVLGVRTVEDNIHAVRFGAGYFALDALGGLNRLEADLSRGLGGTRESDSLKSRAEGDSRFGKFVFDYERVQPFSNDISLTLGLGGQRAGRALLSSEQFALGGRRFGRAYEPAELVGDHAFAFRLEPAWQGATHTDLRIGYQIYGFYDVGKVWSEGRELPGVPSTRSLASSGFGLRANLEKNTALAFEAAWPLTRPVASYQSQGQGKSGRLFASLTLSF